MFGKIFETMFTGSMVGSGPYVFAVWPFVIANQKPDKEHGSVVELNPKLLAAIIGCEQGPIEEAIGFLCSPDEESRSEELEGRRLVKIGAFEYRVINGAKYRAIRDHETRKEQNRMAKRKERSKLKLTPLKGESAHVAAENGGASQEQLDHIIGESLPKTAERVEWE
jgi:hypothetical protein